MEPLTNTQGWHILPSGLPVLVANNVSEIPLEKYVACCIRKEVAKGPCQPGDVWVQAFAMTTEEFETTPRVLKEVDEEFGERHDAELPNNLLSSPGEFFKEPPEENFYVPEANPGDDGGGVDIDDVMGEHGVRGDEPADEEPVQLDEVELSVATPLKELRQVCERMGISKSGSKAKVLRRLKDHKEVMERQLATEVAKKLYKEQDRDPSTMPTPTLPSAKQQELHAITHQPFAPWCAACMMGRSRQSPHEHQSPDRAAPDSAPGPVKCVMQIDFCYNAFTKSKGEAPPDTEEGGDQGDDISLDTQDQRGLNLVCSEFTTGWLLSLPLAAKGTSSLKRVTEALSRLSMQIAEVVIQGDPEPHSVGATPPMEQLRKLSPPSEPMQGR